MLRPILLSFLVATSFVALAPLAHARADACTSIAGGCPDLVCVDADADGFEPAECRGKDDLDPCAFRSDCCNGGLGGGFWCPEDS